MAEIDKDFTITGMLNHADVAVRFTDESVSLFDGDTVYFDRNGARLLALRLLEILGANLEPDQ